MENYVYHCRFVTNLIDNRKSLYYTSIIQENASDQKVLFETVNKLLQKKTVRHYPSAQDNDILAIRFADFFHEKISNIHQSLSARLWTADETPYPPETHPVLLHDFRVVSLEEARGFASKSSCKSCNLDQLQALIVKG